MGAAGEVGLGGAVRCAVRSSGQSSPSDARVTLHRFLVVVARAVNARIGYHCRLLHHPLIGLSEKPLCDGSHALQLFVCVDKPVHGTKVGPLPYLDFNARISGFDTIGESLAVAPVTGLPRPIRRRRVGSAGSVRRKCCSCSTPGLGGSLTPKARPGDHIGSRCGLEQRAFWAHLVSGWEGLCVAACYLVPFLASCPARRSHGDSARSVPTVAGPVLSYLRATTTWHPNCITMTRMPGCGVP